MVTENTATSITITWDSGNPDPVSYYVIEYKSKSQDGPYQIKEDITTTRYSIGGLSPNSEYEIWVSAVNSIGQGPPSESVVTRTGEQAPASAPRNVQARMLSATTMIIQWEEPVEPNGLIRGYRVYYTMEPEHPVGNWQKHNVDDSLLTTVGSLLEDETYTVRVLAFTSVGDGPLSDPIQVKTQQGGEVPGDAGGGGARGSRKGAPAGLRRDLRPVQSAGCAPHRVPIIRPKAAAAGRGGGGASGARRVPVLSSRARASEPQVPKRPSSCRRRAHTGRGSVLRNVVSISVIYC